MRDLLSLNHAPGRHGRRKFCVRFYGSDEKVFGEFGPHEGLMIPRNARYWFEQVGDEERQLLQVAGRAQDNSKNRVNIEQTRPAYGKALHYNYPPGEDVDNRQG